MIEQQGEPREGGRFSPLVEQVLRENGWYPGRQVDEWQMQQWYAFHWTYGVGYCRIFPAALRVMREFGGLTIKQDGPGFNCYRNSFVFDPLQTLDFVEDGWIYHEWAVEDTLYPLGFFPREDRVLCMATSGKVYSFHQDMSFEADSFDQALEHLIRGITSRDYIQVWSDRPRVEEAKKVQEAVQKLFQLKRVDLRG